MLKRKKNIAIFTSSMVITLAIVFCIACIAVYLWFTSDSYYVNSTDKSHDNSVAMSFTMALIENKEVKPLVAQHLWPEIDEWIIKHEVFTCPEVWSLGKRPFCCGRTVIDIDTRSFKIIESTYCSDVGGRYSFGINDLILKRFDGEWVVYGWDKICETLPGEEECHNPLED